MPKDERGPGLTTGNAEAAAAFDATLRHTLENHLDTAEHLARVFEADPAGAAEALAARAQQPVARHPAARVPVASAPLRLGVLA